MNRIVVLLLATISFLSVSAGISYAADAPPFTWNGIYFGGHGGYSGSKIFPLSDPLTEYGSRAWAGGLQVGYNVQLSHWVIGGEIDYSWTHLSSSKQTGFVVGAPFINDTLINSFGTARARFGYAADRALFYATGGLGWAHTRLGFSFAGNSSPESALNQFGWTIGGGAEYALDSNWSVKIEYLHADFGRTQVNLDSPFESFNRWQDLKLDVVRAGLNYRFGGANGQGSARPASYAAVHDPLSGSYLGLHGGYGWGQIKYLSDFPPIGMSDIKPDGGFGGLQAGYNWRFAQHWLAGLESDLSFGDIANNGRTTGVPDPASSGKIDYFSTARARFGYLGDQSLWYVTAGLAAAHMRVNVSGTPNAGFPPAPNPTHIKTEQFAVGWTVGGGVEYAIDPVWSLKAEYLYADLGKNVFFDQQFESEQKLQTVKIGLNYHGPLIERFFGRN